MDNMQKSRQLFIFGLVVLLGIFVSVFSTGTARAERTFARKDCSDCHKKFNDKYGSMKYAHTMVKENKCEDCHLRHGIVPKLLLKKDGNQLCLGCHPGDKIGLTKAKVHTPLKGGKCTACHNPHASQGRYLLNSSGNEACYQCHKKEIFEKKVVHKVLLDKGCTACHLAHSSDQDNLLSKAEPKLCLDCHDAKGGAFKKAHGNYPVETKKCTTCHNPHSSTQAKLLKTTVHNPVATVGCDGCHNAPTSPKPFEVTQKGSELCMQCHDAKTLKAGGNIEHQPFKAGDCLSCH